MAETSLLIRVATTGAGQAVRDVLDTQKALAGIANAAKDARKFAEELGKALNLPRKDVDDLADAIQGAAEQTNLWRDANGRLRDENGRFVKEAKDGFDSLGRSIKGSSGLLESLFTGVLQGVGQQITQGFTEAISKIGDLAGKAGELGIAFNGAQAKVGTLVEDVDGLTTALDGVRESTGNQVSTIDLLGGAYDIASAGFSNAADAAQIAEASVRGAIGGFSDFGTVADGATSVLNAYGLAAGDVDSVIDKFIATQNAGKITVDQYAAQIGKVAPLAAQAGVSLDELNGFIATATVKGVQVESSFSGLRQALAAVLKPTSDAAQKAAELGIQFDAQALKTKGLAGILAELNAKGQDTPEVLTQLFGSIEAVAAIAPSAGEGLKDLQANIEASAQSAGDAEAAFRKVSESLPGQIQALQVGFNEGLRNVGTAFEPVLTGLLSLVNDVFAAFGDSFSGFDPIIEAGEKLKISLEENPELAQQLGEAFAGIADVAVDQIAQIIDSIRVLSENQDAINGVTEALADVATGLELIGEATQFLITLVDVLFTLDTSFQQFLDTVGGIPVVGDGLVTAFSIVGSALSSILNPINSAIDAWQNFQTEIAPVIMSWELLESQITSTGIAAEGVGGQLASGLNKANEALGTLGQKAQEIAAPKPQDQQQPEAVDLKALQEAEAAKEKAEKDAKDRRIELAREQADQLKELREDEKREATEAFRDTADAAKEAFDEESTAAKRATDDRIEQRKRAVDAEIEAEQNALDEKERLFKDEFAQRESALKSQQDLEKQALESSQAEAKTAAEAKFEAERQRIERQLQLQNAATPEERQKLQEQFAAEDKTAAERDKAFADLNRKQAEFEAAQAAEREALAQKQAEEQAALEEEKRQRELALQAEKAALEESINQRKLALEDEIKAIKLAAEDELEQRKRAFEEQQREAERAFNDQQRALDRQNADQVAAILKSARGGGQSLRSGGVAEGGIVQVHKDEFLIPPRGTRVVSQQESRALIRESLGQISAPVIVPPPMVQGVDHSLIARMDALLKTLEGRPPVKFGGDQITFINEPKPLEASAMLSMARLRERVRGLGAV